MGISPGEAWVGEDRESKNIVFRRGDVLEEGGGGGGGNQLSSLVRRKPCPSKILWESRGMKLEIIYTLDALFIYSAILM